MDTRVVVPEPLEQSGTLWTLAHTGGFQSVSSSYWLLAVSRTICQQLIDCRWNELQAGLDLLRPAKPSAVDALLFKKSLKAPALSGCTSELGTNSSSLRKTPCRLRASTFYCPPYFREPWARKQLLLNG